MNGNPSPEAAPRLPQICAGIAGGIALLALAGWQINARFLAGQWDAYIPMAPSTALAFLLLGGALFCYARWPAQRLSRLFALAAVSLASLLALLVLAQFSSGLDLGVEQALSRTNELLGGAPLGRMSPLTAIAFLLESAALFILLIGQRWRNAPTAAALLAVIATAINFVVLTGYAYGAPLLYGGTNIPVALPTAIAFVLVGMGQITMAVPSAPALAAWSRATLRGRLLRAFLPSLLVLLLIEGWLEVRIEPFLSPNRALWHSLAALTAGALIAAVTAWIAGRTGDDLEQAQESLRLNEARFRALLENSSDGITVANANGAVTYSSPAISRLLGYTPEERVGHNLTELMHPDEVPTNLAQLGQLMQKPGGLVTTQSRFRRHDGTWRWLEVTDVNLLNEPAVRGIVGNYRDITERRQAEEEIRGYAEQYRTMISTDLFGFWLVDENGKLLDVNDTYCRMSGYTGEELQNLSIPDLEIIESPEDTARRIQKVIETGKDRFESKHKAKDGRVFDVEISTAYWYSQRKFVVFIRDIAERKQAEAELLRLRKAVEASGEVIFLTDSDGLITFVNPEFTHLYGYTAEEVVGKTTPRVLKSGRMKPEDYALFWQTLLSQQVVRGELVNQTKDGRLLTVEGSVNPVLGATGNIAGFLAIQRDITERKRTEEALRESESSLRESQIIAGLGSYVLDFSTGVWKSSGILDKIFGIDETYVRSVEGWADLVHPAERQQMLGYFTNEVIGRRVRFDKEYKIIRKNDQAERWVHGVGELEVDAQNQLLKMHGTITDITERKRAEERLRLSDEILQRVSSLVLVANAQGQITYASPHVTTALGYELAELLGEGWWELSRADPQERAREKDYVTKAARGEAPLSEAPYERQVRARDGEFRWIIWQDARTPGELIVGVGHDITERKQRERELETVAAVSAALRTAETRTEMLPVILDQVRTLLNADGAALDMHDPTSGETVVELGAGDWTHMTSMRIPAGEGVSAQVLATGRPYLSADAQADPRYFRPALSSRTRAVACVPLIAQKQAIGALWVGRLAPISEGEVRLLAAIADIAASAIQRTTLHEQTERRAEQLTALHTIDAAISSSLDLRLTLDVLLDQVMTQLGVDATTVLLFNPHLQTLAYAAGRGFRGKDIEHSRLRLGQGYAGRAALERRTVQLPNLAEEEPDLARALTFAGEDFRAYYGVPLIAKGQVEGVLEIFHRAPLHPDRDWVDFLEALAGQAAIAIDSAQLFDSLQRSNLQLSLAYDATIEGWSRALDLRDKETEGHTRRVTETTLKLARAMGLGEEELLHVRRGALLHDIGKMGVPDGILLKPGPLTDEEWVIMQKHPVYAHEMLAPIVYLRPALDIPYCHHEKWDGTGYPRGLKGEEIPLAARIFAVVDVWDALLSDRPYRPGWPEEKVRAHIRSLAGIHFDSQVADMFLQMIAQNSQAG